MKVIQDNMENNSKHNNSLIMLLSVLLLISCIIAGFFAYQTQKLAKELQEIRSQELVKQTPKPISDSIKDWKTYTNTDFVFKYPSEISLNIKTQGKEIIIEIKGLLKKISLVIDPITDHNFFLNKKIASTIKYNNISWNYLTGNQQYCDGGECGQISDALQTEYKNKRYTIVLGELFYPDTTLDQILSTFKFLDEEIALPISVEELSKGWYWGDINQKKTNTPSDWVFDEAGRSSCWHKVGVNCI